MAKSRRSPRRRRSSRGRARSSWGTPVGILLTVVALALLGGVGVLYWQATEGAVALDDSTLCPVRDGVVAPTGHMVVLVDTSDELPAVQRQNAANELLSAIEHAPRGWRLSVYALQEDTTDLPVPTIQLCNPGSGAELSAITANPELARRRWQAEFVEPVEAAVLRGLQRGEADSSPLLETISGIAASELSTPAARETSRRLVILSDMLQHSATASHYRAAPDLDTFLRSEGYQSLRADLRDVEVEILYIDRARAAGLEWAEHIQFWTDLFNAQGARVERVMRVLG